MSKKDKQVDVDSEFDAAEVLGIVAKNKKNKKSKSPSARLNEILESNSNKDITIPTSFDNIDQAADKIARGKGLSLTQRKAIRLIVAFNYTPDKVSDELSVPLRKVQKWLRQKEFVAMIMGLEKFLSVSSMENRLMQNNEIVDKLYSELRTRLETGVLENVKLSDLINFLTRLNAESRLDDRHNNKSSKAIESGAGNTTINVNLALGSVQERFNLRRIRREALSERDNNRSLAPHQQPVTINVPNEAAKSDVAK